MERGRVGGGEGRWGRRRVVEEEVWGLAAALAGWLAGLVLISIGGMTTACRRPADPASPSGGRSRGATPPPAHHNTATHFRSLAGTAN
ncbi:hypothetical protein E2C01_045281 [Portunus trituberculatus]|uniref:Uncharacterized protein n=1 Tax=Portunus trituberculatus TaxID=210409 RepID=A0A5B7G0U3_PORTR|nr:hypothetical protein [Portunus trituberculatus]